MSYPAEKSWTDEEKNFLLLEILKNAGVSSTTYLLGIIKEHRIDPQWMEMSLPPGRSLKSCRDVYQRMESEYPQHQHYPSSAGPIAPLQTSPGSRKRQLAPVPSSQPTPLPRAIQPKPPSATTHFPVPEPRATVAIPRISDPTSSERPRKRGRPSKIEIQRRQAAAQQRMSEPSRPFGTHPLSTPATSQSSPMGTTPGSAPQLPGATTQHSPEQANRPQQTGASPQAHNPEVRRPSTPQGDVGTLPSMATTSSVPSKESTPRTILDDRVPPSSGPLGPPVSPAFKIANQSWSGPGSPEGATSTAPVTETVASGPRSVPGGMEGEKED